MDSSRQRWSKIWILIPKLQFDNSLILGNLNWVSVSSSNEIQWGGGGGRPTSGIIRTVKDTARTRPDTGEALDTFLSLHLPVYKYTEIVPLLFSSVTDIYLYIILRLQK